MADSVLKDGIQDGNRWLLDAVRFAVGTGLRRGELCNLRWSAVDLDTGFVTIKNTESFSTKSGSERSVYLTGSARDVIDQCFGERTSEADEYVFTGSGDAKVNEDYLSRRFRYYRRLVELPDNISFHSLRHTFASWFVMRGGDIFYLKEILGHVDIATTMIYAHLRPDAIKEEMEMCFGNRRSTTVSD